jgi:Phosphotransferase enzyme family
MSTCPSVLELFLPDGFAAGAVVFGKGCPEDFRPADLQEEPGWDLVVIAPTQEEHESSVWLDEVARTAADGLTVDGLVWVLGNPLARQRVRQVLTGAGLIVTGAVLHLERGPSGHVLLPLAANARRASVDRLAGSGWRALGLRLAARLPVGRLLARRHPTAGLIARRAHARPLAEWLARSRSSSGDGRIAAVGLRHAGDRQRAVIHLLPISGEPSIGKMTLRSESGCAEVRSEFGRLVEVGASARMAGVTVPSGRLVETGAGCPVLLQDVLPGKQASRLLAMDPSRFDELVRRLGGWLDEWSRRTASRRLLSADLLAETVLAPAARLAGSLDDGAAYVGWLETLCGTLAGLEVPFVATHGDLTMANVVVRRDGGIGIVDWEAAEPSGLPLGDFYYAVVDAAAAGKSYADRPAAYRRCFLDDGPPARVVRKICLGLCRSIGVSDACGVLAFHSCWLHHADNERRRAVPSAGVPFLECLRLAAAHPLATPMPR